jgi:hypothetical protein
MQDLRELEKSNERLKSAVQQQAAELAKAVERESAAKSSYDKLVEEHEALLSSHAAAMVDKARVAAEHLAAVRCVPYFSHAGDPTRAHTLSLLRTRLCSSCVMWPFVLVVVMALCFCLGPSCVPVAISRSLSTFLQCLTPFGIYFCASEQRLCLQMYRLVAVSILCVCYLLLRFDVRHVQWKHTLSPSSSVLCWCSSKAQSESTRMLLRKSANWRASCLKRMK